ncbi:MAG: hypothetical protein VCC01_03005 [Candidatus Hydrogenedentota bacterium]
MLKLIERLELKIAVWVVPCLAVLTGCSGNEGEVSGNTELYVHSASQIPFPHTIGSFTRLRIDEGVPDESGTTIEYLFSQVGSDVHVTVSVYQKPSTKSDNVAAAKEEVRHSEAQREQFEQIMAEIIARGTDDEHRFIAMYDIAIEREGKAFFGKRAFFRDKDEIFSNAYLFEFGEWFVEYRCVFARDLERVAEQFLTDHSWGDIETDEESKSDDGSEMVEQSESKS